MQKFLGKVNYLRRFITNLSGKVDAFTQILRLKNDDEFAWGAKQQEAFDRIKACLSKPPVLRKPSRGLPFRLYIAAEEKVIGAALTQEAEGQEYIITYLSRRLLDAESRYSFVKGQIVANFIVKHRIGLEQEADLNIVSAEPWKLYFDGSVCSSGQGVGIVYISHHGTIF